MEKQYCAKCNTFTYVDKHHILPKNIFGEIGDKVILCPNCHREYHKALGYKNLKNKDMKFHLQFWYKWFYGAIILLIIFLSVYGLNLLF